MFADVITAIVPAFNEAARIGQTVRAVRRYVGEVVVVDDGSVDDTAEMAVAAGAQVVRHRVNQGYIAAIKGGFRAAKGKVLVTIDADGEFDPADIPRLVQPILDGEADLVLGVRPTIPRPSERLLNWLAGLRVPVQDSGTGFRALCRELALKLEFPGACICGTSVLEPAALGARIVEIPVQLRQVNKPRQIAWYHLRQLGYVVRWLLRPNFVDD